MHVKLWALAAGFVLEGMTAPAMAYVVWTGAGYYLSDDPSFFHGGAISGPYSSEADCDAALKNYVAGLSQDDLRLNDLTDVEPGCVYWASDPDKEN